MGLSTFERATIRLRAFEIFQGWGTTDEQTGKLVRWSFEERKREAIELAEWAETEPGNHSNQLPTINP